MRLVVFTPNGYPKSIKKLGCIVDNNVIDLTLGYGMLLDRTDPTVNPLRIANAYIPADIGSFLEGRGSSMDAAKRTMDFVLSLDEGQRQALEFAGERVVWDRGSVRLRTPAAKCGRLFCMGGTQRSHLILSGVDPNPDEPRIFEKPRSGVIGPNETIMLPKSRPDKIMGGTELCVVIGKSGKYISESESYEHVAGYTVFNDITSGDYSIDGSIKNKKHDCFSPIGPWILTTDELESPEAVTLVDRINGKEKQRLSNSTMLFSVKWIISFLSSITELQPGDMIATGSGGNPGYLRDGDVVEAVIEEIGVLGNPVKKEV